LSNQAALRPRASASRSLWRWSNRALLVGPGRAAAQHVFFARLAVGVRDQPHFQSGLHLLPVGFFQQGRRVVPQPALRRAGQITRLALAQKSDVRLADHAAVHHPEPFGGAVFFLHRAHDVLDRGDIGAVAGKDLEGERQTRWRAD